MSDQIVNITVSHTAKEVSITAMRGEEPLFLAWKEAVFLTGVKKTGIDAGVMPSFSVTDDYLYVLVQGGAVGEAIWKKTVLFQSI